MMKQKILPYLFTGLGIGSVVSTVCLILMEGVNSTLTQVAGWLIASACYGLISLILEATVIPRPGQIALHCVLCYTVTCATALLLGYGAQFSPLPLKILPSFVVIYVVVLLGCMFYAQHTARQLNKKLDSMQR